MATSIYEFTQLPPVEAGGSRKPRARRQREPGEAPCVGVIYNPRSHGNQGADFDIGMSPHVHIAQPGDRSQLPLALADFAEKGIDLLVINGGDGTVRDVITSGAAIFGDDWPAIAVLPKGKTNALTVDLGVPGDWTMHDAIDAFERDARVYRRPVAISTRDHVENQVLGFVLGAGAFTFATKSGQSAHKLGAFNQLAVASATLWAILQAFLGAPDNKWRQGSRMQIALGENEVPLERSAHGDPEWRQLLFASTLETLPAGINAFGNFRHGLKLVVFDHLSRRGLLSILSMVRGKTPENLRERGVHQVATPQFTLKIEDQFIFDGEAFPAGEYCIGQGPELEFVTA